MTDEPSNEEFSYSIPGGFSPAWQKLITSHWLATRPESTYTDKDGQSLSRLSVS